VEAIGVWLLRSWLPSRQIIIDTKYYADVLRSVRPSSGLFLEVAGGTGEHGSRSAAGSSPKPGI
jgi:hypothetical protein